MTAPARPRVLSIQPFPPPITGMAIVSEWMTGLLERGADVRRVNVAAPALHRSPRYHAVRVARNLRAMAAIAGERRRCRTVYLSANAGLGMYYTIAQVALARVLGYRIYLQHHCYNYVNEYRRAMAVLVTLMRPGGTHVVVCAGMKSDFESRYPGAHAEQATVAYAIEVPDRSPAVPVEPVGSSGTPAVLRLGMLGNLTEEKGLARALDVVERATDDGVKVELTLAGPIPEPADQALLAARAPALGDAVRHIGPVYGEDRDAFLRGLDVLLFPTRYVNESFGLVVWEAMIRGVPTIAYRAGCLRASAIGEGGVVIEPDLDFAEHAVPVLARWADDPGERRRVGAIAASSARGDVHDGTREAESMAAAIVAGTRPGS